MTDDERARDALFFTATSYLTPAQSAVVDRVAAAIASAYRRGAEETRERCKAECEAEEARLHRLEEYTLMASGAGRCADRIAALALPTGPAAPEGEHAGEEGGWAREVLKVDAATIVLIRNTAIEECIADLAAAMDVESTSWPDLIELVRMPRRVRRGGGA